MQINEKLHARERSKPCVVNIVSEHWAILLEYGSLILTKYWNPILAYYWNSILTEYWK